MYHSQPPNSVTMWVSLMLKSRAFQCSVNPRGKSRPFWSSYSSKYFWEFPMLYLSMCPCVSLSLVTRYWSSATIAQSQSLSLLLIEQWTLQGSKGENGPSLCVKLSGGRPKLFYPLELSNLEKSSLFIQSHSSPQVLTGPELIYCFCSYARFTKQNCFFSCD